MKYCVTCGISNLKVKFTESQCNNCYDINPIKQPIQVPFIKKEKKVKKCSKCGDVIRRICIKCENNLLRKKLSVKREKKQKIIKEKIIYLCKYCFKPENEGFYISEKGIKYKYHLKCKQEIEKQKEIEKIKNRKKRGRVAKTDIEKMALIPEFKICRTCLENQHISNYYVRDFCAYLDCKKCHNKATRKNALDNRERTLEYHRNYNKAYKRKRGIG